jgi:hypothetical protein
VGYNRTSKETLLRLYLPPVEVAKWRTTHDQMDKWQKKSKGVGPPTTQASSAAARSSRPGVASRAPGSKGGKNKITSNEGGAPIIVVKLLRTDTTLDLSQKARVVRKQDNERREAYIPASGLRTDHQGYTCWSPKTRRAPPGTKRGQKKKKNFFNLSQFVMLYLIR